MHALSAASIPLGIAVDARWLVLRSSDGVTSSWASVKREVAAAKASSVLRDAAVWVARI
jgi:hypothetical protein